MCWLLIFQDVATLYLARAASTRLLTAFRPATRKSYVRTFQDFLAFLAY